jgi:hypothetical protein
MLRMKIKIKMIKHQCLIYVDLGKKVIGMIKGLKGILEVMMV